MTRRGLIIGFLIHIKQSSEGKKKKKKSYVYSNLTAPINSISKNNSDCPHVCYRVTFYQMNVCIIHMKFGLDNKETAGL